MTRKEKASGQLLEQADVTDTQLNIGTVGKCVCARRKRPGLVHLDKTQHRRVVDAAPDIDHEYDEARALAGPGAELAVARLS